jgi:starch synthase
VHALGIDLARPRVVFVGRITRQKGIPFLLRAAARFRHGVQLILVAGSPDEPEIAEEVATLVESMRASGRDVIWIDRTLPRRDLIEVLSTATVFVCPSLYEPLGIVNLEAMACGAPVVATRTGGIPEVVEDGATGWLVPFEPADELSTPADPRGFEEALADLVNDLIDHPERAEAFGRAGRARVEAQFSWEAVAARTVEVYERVVRG